MGMAIGLTGGIASGKSTVSNLIKQLGIAVIDADKLAREVVEIGKPAYNEIVAAFGEGILQPDGSINRGKLGAIIFNDESKRTTLNLIVHPAVREQMNIQKEFYINQGKTIVLDIPLLFESKLPQTVDKTVLVYVDKETQLTRLMARNQLTEKEALARVRAQMPLDEKRQLADEVIDNNNTIAATEAQLKRILMKWDIL